MKSLIKLFIRKIQVAIILYAINDRDSFEHLQKWVDLVQSVNKEIIIIIIGNKSDRFLFGMVPESEAKEFAIKIIFYFLLPHAYMVKMSSLKYYKDYLLIINPDKTIINLNIMLVILNIDVMH